MSICTFSVTSTQFGITLAAKKVAGNEPGAELTGSFEVNIWLQCVIAALGYRPEKQPVLCGWHTNHPTNDSPATTLFRLKNSITAPAPRQ